MKKLAIACALLLGLPAAATAAGGGCDVCRTVLVCDPECAIYSVCRSAHFGQGRDDCDATGGSCVVWGGYCQWAEFRREPVPDLIAAIFGHSTECPGETGS